MDTARGFSEDRSRPSLPVLGGIVLLHAAVLYGLIRAFAPDLILLDQDAGFAAFDLTQPRPSPRPPPRHRLLAPQRMPPVRKAIRASVRNRARLLPRSRRSRSPAATRPRAPPLPATPTAPARQTRARAPVHPERAAEPARAGTGRAVVGAA